MSIEFLATALVVALAPGTGVLYTLASGLGGGLRGGALAAFGCTLGIMPHLAACVLGLAALLHASALAFQIVKFLGVAFLLYMAWDALRSGDKLALAADESGRSTWRILRDGVLLNILNPKLSLFFLAFLPQFVAADSAAPTLAMIGLGLVFMAITLVVFLLYGACAALARRHVIERPAVIRWLKRGFAASFAALGARLALAER